MGPYAEMSIITRKTDVDETDNKPGMVNAIIGLCLLGPVLWVVSFMGLFCWAYIGLLAPAIVIGLLIWACGRYGTNNSIIDRFRYRTTSRQRAKIVQRLSDIKEKAIL